MQRFHAFFLTCVLLHFEPTVSKRNTKLLLVQFLYRHGDRNPVSLYPNDPNPECVFREGLGQLTSLGKRQHYELGKYFRSLYKDFSNYRPSEIHVLSSSSDRCLMSAEANLATFYTPEPEWTFKKNVHWQPIPIHYIPEKEDRYLKTGSHCPAADKESERIMNSPGSQRFNAEHKETYKKLSALSGLDIHEWTDASSFRDTIFIEKKYNLSVPFWVEPYYDELTNISNVGSFWSFNSPLLHRLRAGPLLKRIIKNMKEKIEGHLKDLKFQVFSAHDTNIDVVLQALNLYNCIPPPYCATLQFELHEMSDGEKALRLLYLNSTQPEEKIEDPHILVLDGCTEFCPFEYFVNYTKDVIPENWEQECKVDH